MSGENKSLGLTWRGGSFKFPSENNKDLLHLAKLNAFATVLMCLDPPMETSFRVMQFASAEKLARAHQTSVLQRGKWM